MVDTGFLPALAHDFPQFEFYTTWTYSGLAVCAQRRADARADGLYLVICHDMNEMRRELAAAA